MYRRLFVSLSGVQSRRTVGLGEIHTVTELHLAVPFEDVAQIKLVEQPGCSVIIDFHNHCFGAAKVKKQQICYVTVPLFMGETNKGTVLV